MNLLKYCCVLLEFFTHSKTNKERPYYVFKKNLLREKSRLSRVHAFIIIFSRFMMRTATHGIIRAYSLTGTIQCLHAFLKSKKNKMKLLLTQIKFRFAFIYELHYTHYYISTCFICTFELMHSHIF